jgi:uncharacterized protein YjbI with pentapeptide repeats
MATSEHLYDILKQHETYVVSNGKKGKIANLNGFYVENAVIENMNLQGIFFNDAKLKNAKFINTNFSYGTFSYAYLYSASFIGCTLEKTKFDFSNLYCARFENTNCTKTSFIEAQLSSACFDSSTLDNVNFYSAILKETILPKKDLKLGKLYNLTSYPSFISMKKIHPLVCLVSVNWHTISLLDGEGTLHKSIPNWIKYSMQEVET